MPAERGKTADIMFRDGVINIYKPEGWTSQDVCSKLRHRLHIRKAGHTGTLDPMATGVLPVCMGKATRIIEYYDLDMKTYRAVLQLGVVTDTLDMTGQILEKHSYEDVTMDAVHAVFGRYIGDIWQIPPRYSALKVDGRRAYDLARDGARFELSKRKIHIDRSEIISTEPGRGTIEFDVRCSKGTYIRTLCDDIGRELGCGAAMAALTRTATGCFDISASADIRDIVEMSDDDIARLVIPMDETLLMLGKVRLNDNRITAFINGNSSDRGYSVIQDSGFTVQGSAHTGQDARVYRVYGREEFLGTATIENGTLIPAKVIYR